MRTKIIAALLAVLTCLGGLNLYQSIKDRLFPEAVAYMQDAKVESTGKGQGEGQGEGEDQGQGSDQLGRCTLLCVHQAHANRG